MNKHGSLIGCLIISLLVFSSCRSQEIPDKMKPDRSKETTKGLSTTITVPADAMHIYNPYQTAIKVVVVYGGKDSYTITVEPGAYNILPRNENAKSIIAYGSNKKYCTSTLQKNRNYDIVWYKSKKYYCLQLSKKLKTGS